MITPDRVQRGAAHVTDRLGRLDETADTAQRFASCAIRRHAARDVRLGFELDVERELLVDFGFDRAPP